MLCNAYLYVKGTQFCLSSSNVTYVETVQHNLLTIFLQKGTRPCLDIQLSIEEMHTPGTVADCILLVKQPVTLAVVCDLQYAVSCHHKQRSQRGVCYVLQHSLCIHHHCQ